MKGAPARIHPCKLTVEPPATASRDIAILCLVTISFVLILLLRAGNQ